MNVKIVETASGLVTSTKQFIWCDDLRCEDRNASGNISKQFFAQGQCSSATSHFYSHDQIGSVRDFTDNGGAVQSQYFYDPSGRGTVITGTQLADFQFAFYYLHERSGLNLLPYRAYAPAIGRWMSRDPLGEGVGINLYSYAINRPTSVIDPSGLDVWNVPLDTFAQNLGVSAGALTAGGCFDIVNAALGMPSGTRPDAYKTTKCWYGPDAQKQAQDYIRYVCKCEGVLWQKRGLWVADPPSSPGPIDPRMIAPRPIDYTTLWMRPGPYLGMYVDLNGAGPGTTGNATKNPRTPGGAGIWCGTCRKGN